MARDVVPQQRRHVNVTPELPPEGSEWRRRLHTIVFEADTAAGRAFDLALIVLIVLSVVVVSAETMPGLSAKVRELLRAAEWTLTVIFTIEFVLRLIAVRRPSAYAASFFGVVDLLAILPTWVSLFVPAARVLLVVRVLRLLRIFRILKLARYLEEAQVLRSALRASSRKIGVFLLSVATLVVIIGSVMYAIEGPANGFTSIPTGMYWAVVTLTTVGYGDISPRTPLGQTLASMVMILGYGIIAVPTGIVTAELTRSRPDVIVNSQHCDSCGASEHGPEAAYCHRCGAALRAGRSESAG